MAKHSHETGKLSHLEMVIMLTTAHDRLDIPVKPKPAFEGDQYRLFKHCMQQAFEHGKRSGQ
ncbi:hypothetical protein LCGC14_1633580 [marine sediment metagenome]|uniref:Uncharacterized protein n=1 Tax=marine sediment metagenome TaxID=412755 RepID=A0A0F9KHJ1_9ZZZZ